MYCFSQNYRDRMDRAKARHESEKRLRGIIYGLFIAVVALLVLNITMVKKKVVDLPHGETITPVILKQI